MYVRTRGFGQVADQQVADEVLVQGEKTLVAVSNGQEKTVLAVPAVDAVNSQVVVITPPSKLPSLPLPLQQEQTDPCAVMRAQMPTCFPAGAAPCPECPPCPSCPDPVPCVCPECATCAECPACAECPECAEGGGVVKTEAVGGFAWWKLLVAAGAGVAVGIAVGRATK